MKSYHETATAEKEELDRRATQLSEFIGSSPDFAELDADAQGLLKVQNDLMWQMSEVLGALIKVLTPRP